MNINEIIKELNKIQGLLDEKVKLVEQIKALKFENSKLKEELIYQKNKQEPIPEWILNSNSLLTFAEVSKSIFDFDDITSNQKLFNILRLKRVLDVENRPRSEFKDLGYFKLRYRNIPNTKRICIQTCFTPIGVIAIYDLLMESGYVTKLNIHDIINRLQRQEKKVDTTC